MIEFYTAATPNGQKVAIMLEELGLPYTTHKVDLNGEQFRPEFLAISPNNKIPAIRDTETGIALAESGAILLYLAEKTGQFWPSDLASKAELLQWVMIQMASVGPMMGQLFQFRRAAPEAIPFAINRYDKEVRRLFGVLDRRLAEKPYLCGDYGIADILTWPWINVYDALALNLDEYPNLKRWHAAVASRPAVQRAMNAPGATYPRAVIKPVQPISVTLEAGKKYAWCSCGRSATQPFCDGAHKGSGMQPVIFTAEQSGEAWICACKATKGQPFCDGFHNRFTPTQGG